eukprot:6061-Heterococcus_DN1.PRE.1
MSTQHAQLLHYERVTAHYCDVCQLVRTTRVHLSASEYATYGANNISSVHAAKHIRLHLHRVLRSSSLVLQTTSAIRVRGRVCFDLHYHLRTHDDALRWSRLKAHTVQLCSAAKMLLLATAAAAAAAAAAAV